MKNIKNIIQAQPLTLRENLHQKIRLAGTGFALFAMFFGAGNMVFPLVLGATAGQYLGWVAAAFIFVEVGTTFLGLFATSLFQGDYWAFFGRLGKVPAFIIVTFIIFIIGPLFAAPRTETITYEALVSFLPAGLNKPIVFSLLYCSIVFLLTFRENSVVDIIGFNITPVKLISFGVLILLSLVYFHNRIPTHTPPTHLIMNAISMGYSTMDMLGAFFFCAIAVRSIHQYAEKYNISDEKNVVKLLVKACCVGATLLALVYLGFMYAASAHAALLRGLQPTAMITVLSKAILSDYGSILVAFCVTFACLATAIALADVSSTYLQKQFFRNKLSKNKCLLIIVTSIFIMSNLGFDGIMKYSLPILKAIYPGLIVLCMCNILYKLFGFLHIKIPFYTTITISSLLVILNYFV